MRNYASLNAISWRTNLVKLSTMSIPTINLVWTTLLFKNGYANERHYFLCCLEAQRIVFYSFRFAISEFSTDCNWCSLEQNGSLVPLNGRKRHFPVAQSFWSLKKGTRTYNSRSHQPSPNLLGPLIRYDLPSGKANYKNKQINTYPWFSLGQKIQVSTFL